MYGERWSSAPCLVSCWGKFVQRFEVVPFVPDVLRGHFAPFTGASVATALSVLAQGSDFLFVFTLRTIFGPRKWYARVEVYDHQVPFHLVKFYAFVQLWV